MSKDAVRAHFDNRSAEYDKLTSWTRNERLVSRAIKLLNLQTGAKLIDVGSGTGAIVEQIVSMELGIKQCVALDSSPEMLERTERLALIEPCLADAHDMPFKDDNFTHAVARQSLHYMKNPSKVIREVHRVLRGGGVFVIAQITPFGILDQEHWMKITACRQPLRKNLLTLDRIVRILLRAGFLLSSVEQIRFRSSLNSWLRRYEASKQQTAELWTLFRDAPADYQLTHAIEDIGSDILYDNCWTYIQAVKL
jgi:ubiquinone/menaquinone biosynthesis C-methylase UbiE